MHGDVRLQFGRTNCQNTVQAHVWYMMMFMCDMWWCDDVHVWYIMMFMCDYVTVFGSGLDGSALRIQHERMCDCAVKLIASTTAILSLLVCLLHLCKTIVAYRTVLLASYWRITFLHWVSIQQRIQYKINTLCYKCITGTYLCDCFQLYTPSRTLSAQLLILSASKFLAPDSPLLFPTPFLFSVHQHVMTFPFLSDRNPL